MIFGKVVFRQIYLEAMIHVFPAGVLILEKEGHYALLDVQIEGLVCEMHCTLRFFDIIYKIVLFISKVPSDGVKPG